MKIYTERQEVKLSKQQKETLSILESYGVNKSQFIRQAIKEKIKREWQTIKTKKENINTPNWVNE